MKVSQRKKIKRSFLILLVSSILLIICARMYYRLTDDFRLANITYNLPYEPRWQIPPLTPNEEQQLDSILAQKFSYIGKGAQSYAFQSADHRYVLKFFKFKHLKPSWLMTMLPNVYPFSKLQETNMIKKERRVNSIFTGYKLAYDVHKNESGLIFIQLNPSHISKKVTVIDKVGFEREIDLGDVVYILQEKGQTLRAVLSQLLDKGEVALAKQRIDQIMDLYLAEYRKGIYDRDHGIMHNAGFVGDKPLHLDVGKLTEEEQMKYPGVYSEDLSKVIEKISTWVKKNYPQYYSRIVPTTQAVVGRVQNN